MFLPSLLVVKATIEVKFVVAITSVSAIIFFSALVPCILATEIKVPIWQLLLIWFVRVTITLLITIPLSLISFLNEKEKSYGEKYSSKKRFRNRM